MAKPPDISHVSSHKNAAQSGREILVECTQFGSIMRVVAIDATTGTEVTFQAPLATSQTTLQRIAKDKLNYVMGKGK